MIKERAPLALKLASRIKKAEPIAVHAFGSRTTTSTGTSKGYSVAIRSLEGEVIDSFDLPDQEIAIGDCFILWSRVGARHSHRNPWQGTTYYYSWEYMGLDGRTIELLLNDNVVGSTLITH